MAKNKTNSHIPAVAAIPDGKYPEIDKDGSFSARLLLDEILGKIEELEARIIVLEP